jgi:hypothetical protein
MRLGISNKRNLQGDIQIHHFLKTQKPKRFFTSFLDDGPSILDAKPGVKKPLLRLRLAVLEPVFYAEIQALGNLTRLRCWQALSQIKSAKI